MSTFHNIHITILLHGIYGATGLAVTLTILSKLGKGGE
jgi:hypothetical protein